MRPLRRGVGWGALSAFLGLVVIAPLVMLFVQSFQIGAPGSPAS